MKLTQARVLTIIVELCISSVSFDLIRSQRGTIC